jgi:hypothetical protein
LTENYQAKSSRKSFITTELRPELSIEI